MSEFLRDLIGSSVPFLLPLFFIICIIYNVNGKGPRDSNGEGTSGGNLGDSSPLSGDTAQSTEIE